MKKYLSLLAVSVLLVVALAVPALAQDQNGTATAAKQKAQERIAEIKTQIEARKLQLSQDKCERHKARLEAAIPRLGTHASRHLAVIDKIYERVQGFYESGQLTVSNYEELKATIDAAQVDASAAVTALQEYQIEVDCESEDVGEQLDGVREAANQAKEALKTYRKALVELISSLRAEAAEQNAQNGDDTTNEAETEEGETDEN